ncbi:MAG: SMP-30/gluconolactonase/LRE family protein [Kineosporiaceae bacterium]
MSGFAAWRPPAPPELVGLLAPNEALTGARLVPVPGGTGPEDAVVGTAGEVFSAVADGRILRWQPGGEGEPAVVASTGGRPLGVEVDADGSLIVCDSDRGLLRVRVDDGGTVEVLVAAGSPAVPGGLRFCNNATIGPDGTVYFTNSSAIAGVHDYRRDLLAHQPSGSLMALPPGAREPSVVAQGLYFANGVALTADGTAALVAETATYRVLRVPLDGDEVSVAADNLPGFPDNLSRSPRGTFWLALPDGRSGALDSLLPRPRIRRLVAALPESWQPQPARYGLVLELTEDGTVLRSLHDPTGRVAFRTGAREHDGLLYLGSLSEPTLAVVDL